VNTPTVRVRPFSQVTTGTLLGGALAPNRDAFDADIYGTCTGSVRLYWLIKRDAGAMPLHLAAYSRGRFGVAYSPLLGAMAVVAREAQSVPFH
jgi:hypothetical protein